MVTACALTPGTVRCDAAVAWAAQRADRAASSSSRGRRVGAGKPASIGRRTDARCVTSGVVSSTPAQKFVCPRCRTSFDEPSHFCRECGADMTRASALDAAARSRSGMRRSDQSTDARERDDRRLTDSNQAWLGKIVDGRYRVLEVIGRGGMGVVYRVEHLRMGKIAAMKVLHRDLAERSRGRRALRARGGRGLEAAPPAHRAGLRLRHRAAERST